ncbi:hypothetical protein RF11_13023 [Thelohanellus kitauei]|uniref:Uncharacterized protein n=1 Tax=Thelohanellus kitauei TaxID=669202 RepID=A0A0C2N759_THEKT|nr:hypothetical protein RF11_13023 [Thelohanellus kitauei]
MFSVVIKENKTYEFFEMNHSLNMRYCQPVAKFLLIFRGQKYSANFKLTQFSKYRYYSKIQKNRYTKLYSGNDPHKWINVGVNQWTYRIEVKNNMRVVNVTRQKDRTLEHSPKVIRAIEFLMKTKNG